MNRFVSTTIGVLTASSCLASPSHLPFDYSSLSFDNSPRQETGMRIFHPSTMVYYKTDGSVQPSQLGTFQRKTRVPSGNGRFYGVFIYNKSCVNVMYASDDKTITALAVVPGSEAHKLAKSLGDKVAECRPRSFLD